MPHRRRNPPTPMDEQCGHDGTAARGHGAPVKGPPTMPADRQDPTARRSRHHPPNTSNRARATPRAHSHSQPAPWAAEAGPSPSALRQTQPHHQRPPPHASRARICTTACTQSALPQSVPLSLRDAANANRHRQLMSLHEPSLPTSQPTQQHAAHRTNTPDAVRLQYRRPHDPNPQISRAHPRRDTRGMPRLSTYVLTGMRTTAVPSSTRPQPADASAPTTQAATRLPPTPSTATTSQRAHHPHSRRATQSTTAALHHVPTTPRTTHPRAQSNCRAPQPTCGRLVTTPCANYNKQTRR
jgi:hypothetical protein